MTDEQHKQLLFAINRLGIMLTNDELEWCRAVRTAAQIVAARRMRDSFESEWEFTDDVMEMAQLIYECYGFGADGRPCDGPNDVLSGRKDAYQVGPDE